MACLLRYYNIFVMRCPYYLIIWYMYSCSTVVGCQILFKTLFCK